MNNSSARGVLSPQLSFVGLGVRSPTRITRGVAKPTEGSAIRKLVERNPGGCGVFDSGGDDSLLAGLLFFRGRWHRADHGGDLVHGFLSARGGSQEIQERVNHPVIASE